MSIPKACLINRVYHSLIQNLVERMDILSGERIVGFHWMLVLPVYANRFV